MLSQRSIAVMAVLVTVLGVSALFMQTSPSTSTSTVSGDVQTFTSASDFKSYLAETGGAETTTVAHRSSSATYGAAGGDTTVKMDAGTAPTESMDAAAGTRTNVQVAGIDEPDRVKTDGNRIYLRGDSWRHAFNTTVIGDLPDMQIDANLSAQGELLLHNDTLIVLGTDTVTAYRVAEGDATQVWEETLDHGVKTARIIDGQLVLVLSDQINRNSPCPIRPMNGLSVPCTSIYYPGYSVPVDATYSVVSMNTATGDVTDETAFIGSPHSTVYVSGDGVYVAYTQSEQQSDIQMDFLLNHASIDSDTRNRLQTVDGYELSERARQEEMEHIMRQWMDENPDQAETIDDEMEQYIEERKRDIEETTLARVNPETMELAGEATVPGRVTDRMHLHTYDDRLAVLSSINPRGFPANHTTDLIQFDQSMEDVDTVRDIVTDRVRNARFSGTQLFLTANDQLDIYDLSTGDVTAQFDTTPQYLHPLDDNQALAVGRVEQEVEREFKEQTGNDGEPVKRRKIRNLSISLLNVADGTVADEVVLDQPWSRVSHDLHAFQHDPATERFFLPSSQTSYVGSYSDGTTMHTVNASYADRAFFIDDHLYTVGHDTVKAFDDNQNTVSTLTLPERERDHPDIENRLNIQ